MPYTLQGNCVHKENADGTSGERIKCHETRAKALAHLRALQAATAGEYMSDYLLDEYVSVTAGEPFRLFPFGKLVKNGETRFITKELAAKFRLPHFKPPIKRGSHKDDAPAGGFITALEVREDGLYAIPEFNEKGEQAIVDGDFRYHSPEVIWSDGPVFEDPQTGEMINGPLIVGDALLHTPHLGEAAALYSVQPIQREVNMTEGLESVSVPKSLWAKIEERWFAKEEPQNEPEPVVELEAEPKPAVEVEQFEAIQKERDEYKAQLDRMAAEAKQKERVDKYTAAIAETKANNELVELLAGLDDETADRIVQEFKALSAQIKESALLDEKGTTGDGLPEDPADAYDAAVKAKQTEKGISYNAARALVDAEMPELAKAYAGG